MSSSHPALLILDLLKKNVQEDGKYITQESYHHRCRDHELCLLSEEALIKVVSCTTNNTSYLDHHIMYHPTMSTNQLRQYN